MESAQQSAAQSAVEVFVGFLELLELHSCVPGTLLDSGDKEMDKSVFALWGALDLVKEKGMRGNHSNKVTESSLEELEKGPLT